MGGFMTMTNSGTWEVKSFAEVEAEDRERRKHRLAYVQSGYLSIKAYPPHSTYDIAKRRLKTPGMALGWVHQISEKTWAWENGAQIMQDFLEVLFETIPTSFWAGKA